VTEEEESQELRASEEARESRSSFMATVVRVRQSGPYRIDGDDVTVLDWNGKPYTITKLPIALCRCGASTTKPFCDGTHSKIGFQAAEAAVPGSEDKPAE